MFTKQASYPTASRTLTGQGQVEALVSVFGNVDRQGDRVMPGAFAESIKKWKESGDPIPVIVSHDWGNVWSHIGVVDDLEETAKGLKVIYTLDVEDNPVAAQVYRLQKRRSLKEHSFAYGIVDERRAKDGANNLVKLDIIEIGPTLKGANPSTELMAVKALIEGDTTPAPVADPNEPPPVTDPPEEPPVEVVADPIDVDGAAAADDSEFGFKVGRRISRATFSQLLALADRLDIAVQEVRGLLSAGDSEEAGNGEDEATSKSRDIDSDLLIFKASIERMRDRTKR